MGDEKVDWKGAFRVRYHIRGGRGFVQKKETGVRLSTLFSHLNIG